MNKRRPYKLEWWCKWWPRKWRTWKRYARKSDRDKAFEAVCHSRKGLIEAGIMDWRKSDEQPRD